MEITNCIDAGTEYCPCSLAEIGECVMCSQLQGRVFCDCINWQGVCIYWEYIWRNKQCKTGRSVQLCEIKERRELTALVTVLQIQVKKTLARELKQPGAYVFLRAFSDPVFFDVPLSVLQADERTGLIEIVLQKKGVKTKKLLEQIDKFVFLKGPYGNGVLGLKYLKGYQNGQAVLLIRGIGQASALAVAQKLRQGGNVVTVLLDKGKIKVDFTGDLLRQLGCQVYARKLFKDKTYQLAEEVKVFLRENDFGLIYSGGSELLHQEVYNLLAEWKKVHFVCSNNAHLCCGEGVCGSCQLRLPDGRKVKRCKTQLEPASIYQGGCSGG